MSEEMLRYVGGPLDGEYTSLPADALLEGCEGRFLPRGWDEPVPYVMRQHGEVWVYEYTGSLDDEEPE